MTSQAADTHLSTDLTEGVLTLRLGAAPAHALSLGMIRALQAALDTARTDPDVRAIMLIGEGRIFCAGHDMKEIKRHRSDPDQGRAYVETLFRACTDMMLALAHMPQPSIAVVNGAATAGGLQLMTTCDMALASPAARFCLPGVNNGGFCTTPSVAVGRKIARAHLMELALTGDMYGADWALGAGLINRIVPADVLEQEARALAGKMAKRHAPALAKGKAMLYHQLDLPLDQAYAEATDVMIDHFMDPHRIARDLDF